MTPVKSVESSPGNRVFQFTCEVCGAMATEGFGVDLRRAMATGDVKHAGRWYCSAHVPQESERRG